MFGASVWCRPGANGGCGSANAPTCDRGCGDGCHVSCGGNGGYGGYNGYGGYGGRYGGDGYGSRGCGH